MRLIARHDRLLRSVARSCGLASADVDDVVQVTWTRLYQHIDRLRDPQAIAGWLVTTTRREAIRVRQRSVCDRPLDCVQWRASDERARPEVALLAAEERDILNRAVATLPGRQRDLLRLLAAEADTGYAQISTTLELPVGSIGPLRARGLARLARNAELRAHHFAGA